ncbi:hypothetical protein A2U01_0037083, partial [Trifolium medium]|nr:hypothetical protein [Trifolium medium]
WPLKSGLVVACRRRVTDFVWKIKWWLLPLLSVEFGRCVWWGCDAPELFGGCLSCVCVAVVYDILPLVFCICDIVLAGFGVVLPAASSASVTLIWLRVDVVPRNSLPPVV